VVRAASRPVRLFESRKNASKQVIGQNYDCYAWNAVSAAAR
jgi:hypothetical protein